MPTYDGTILDQGGAVFNVRSSAYGATGNGSTNDTSAIQAAVNAAAAVPNGVVLIPPGTYIVTSISLAPGITILGYGATLKRPASQPNWTQTLKFTTLYSGTTDSPPLVIRGLTIDGNSANQGSYHNYELEHSHLIWLEANTANPGRLRVTLEDLVVRNSVADGISIYTNVDAQIINCRADDCFRGGLTVTGGYTRVQVQNFETTGATDPTGIDVEVDGGGYGGTLAVDISIDGMNLDADFDLGVGSGSTVFATNVVVNNAPFHMYTPGSLVRFANSRFRVGTFATGANRIVYPNDLTFENCVFELTGVSEAGAIDGAAVHIFWNLGGSATQSGQRCKFIDCDFRVASGVGSGLTLAAIYAEADDTADDNRLYVLGGTIASRYNYGLYMAQGGTWIVKDTEIEAATGIHWLGVVNPPQSVTNRASLRIERVVFTGTTYMEIVSYDSGNTLDHRDVVLEAAQNVITTTYGIVGNVFKGGRLIRVASAPTSGSVPGLVGDRARLATPVAGQPYEWICTASSTTAATWKQLSALAA